MKTLIPLVLILSLFLAGCGRVSESAISEVLEKDTSFAKVLNEKKRINAEIQALRNAYDKEKDAANEKIRSLKGDLNAAKDKITAQIASLKKNATPQIGVLMEKLDGRKAEYRLKKQELKDSVSKLASIGKLLEKKANLPLSADEISVWNKRAAKLEKTTAALHVELDRLRDKIRIIKTEIKILKQ